MVSGLQVQSQHHMSLLVTLTSLYHRDPLESFCHIGAKQPLEMNVVLVCRFCSHWLLFAGCYINLSWTPAATSSEPLSPDAWCPLDRMQFSNESHWHCRAWSFCECLDILVGLHPGIFCPSIPAFSSPEMAYMWMHAHAWVRIHRFIVISGGVTLATCVRRMLVLFYRESQKI